MRNDPRIKRLLKRYPKGEQFFDASIDVSHLELQEVLDACRCPDVAGLTLPKELDDHALSYFARVFGAAFDQAEFEYFLHSYVRTEFVSSYYDDPTVTSKPPPENGPPGKIPIPKGMRWASVRPRNGREHYEAYEDENPI